MGDVVSPAGVSDQGRSIFNGQLQPHKDRHFKDHWDRAEMNKQKFLEKRSKERSDSGSISSRGGGRPVTLSIRINLGDTKSDLSRPSERQLSTSIPHYITPSARSRSGLFTSFSSLLP